MYEFNDQDTIASTHRGHGHCIAKGCDVNSMMKELFGKKDGMCGGKGGSMHLTDVEKVFTNEAIILIPLQCKITII